MTKTNSKKALLSSAFALVLSVAMLIGTTFAWFTDTASTGVNKIVSGNLKVDIIGENSDSHIEKLNFKKTAATDAEAGAAILWEPGCRYLTEGFRIANKGNLALKWKAQVNMNNIINGKVEGSTIAKDGKSLLDVIDFYVVTKAANGTETEVAIENFVGNLKKTETSEVYYIKGVMQTTAGNDYQDLTLDGITITVIATQDTVENDSFNNQYDKDAEYPILVTTGDELQAIVSNATAPVNIVLTNNITTNNFVIPAAKDVTMDLNGRTVTNAGSHTILNKGHLTLTDSSADKSGQIISLKGNTAALRNGDNAVCVVEGGTISRDGANGNTWHVVENFGKMTFNGGKVVLKNGNGFAITNGWNYFDPGASTTHAVMEINALELDTDSSGIKNCRYGDLTVNDATVTSTGYWALSNDYLGTAVINGGTFTNMNVDALSSYVGTGHTAQQGGTSVIIK